MELTASVVISAPSLRCNIANEPFGTGTLIAFEVNFPFSDGSA